MDFNVQTFELWNNLFEEYRDDLLTMVMAKKLPDVAMHELLLELHFCYVVVEVLGESTRDRYETDPLVFQKHRTYYKVHAFIHGRLADTPLLDGIFFVHNLLLLSDEEEHEKIISMNRTFYETNSRFNKIPLCIVPRYVHTDEELDFWMQFMDEFLLEDLFLSPLYIETEIDLHSQVDCLQRMDTCLLEHDLHWHEDLLYKWYNEYILHHIRRMDAYEEVHTPCGEGFVRKAYLYRNLDHGPYFMELLVFLSPNQNIAKPFYWSEDMMTRVIEFKHHYQEIPTAKCLDIEFVNAPIADEDDASRIRIVAEFIKYTITYARDNMPNVQYLALCGHDWNTYVPIAPFKLCKRLLGPVHSGIYDTWMVPIRKQRVRPDATLLEKLQDTFTLTNTLTKETHTRTCWVVDMDHNTITVSLDKPLILNAPTKHFTTTLQNHMYTGMVHNSSMWDTVSTTPLMAPELNPLRVRVFDTMTVCKGHPLHTLLLHTRRGLFEKVKQSRDWNTLFHSILNDPIRFAFRRRKLIQWFEEDTTNLQQRTIMVVA